MSTLWPSLIAAIALVTGAYLTFSLNRRLTIEADWRKKKLEYYEYWMDTLSQIVEPDATAATHLEFARASNDLLLIAPSAVLKAHHAHRDHIRISNVGRDYDKDDELLAEVINAIRADLNFPDLKPIVVKDVKLWAASARQTKALSADERRPARKPTRTSHG